MAELRVPVMVGLTDRTMEPVPVTAALRATPPYVSAPVMVGAGIDKPDGKVVDTDGTPEPLVTSTPLLERVTAVSVPPLVVL